MGKKNYVIYAKTTDRLLHKAVRSEALDNDMTISEYVASVLRYFMDLAPATKERALKKYQ